MYDRAKNAMPPAAMLVAVLALVLSGAGVGYTAATIGTDDIKDNAVTTAKVKNGTLKAADLVEQRKYTHPRLNDGTEGDCLWQDVSPELDGLPKVGFRVDRFGTTHLVGIMAVEDGPGGDALCGGEDTAEAIDDLTAFRLPKAARPAATVYRTQAFGSENSVLVIPGPGGLQLEPGVVLPHGAVMSIYGSGTAFFLDEIDFETKAAQVGPRTSSVKELGPLGRKLLEGLSSRS